MTAAYLTLNAGSSSLKVAVFAAEGGDTPLASGQVDGIGPNGVLKLKRADGTALPAASGGLATHAEALARVLDTLRAGFPGLEVQAVGHRVVHGGVVFETPVFLTKDVMAKLEVFTPFAPLHQPHNLAAVRAAQEAFPEAAQIACFDTAFHRSHPFVNDTFALPRRYYEKGVRRYGFHGLSYEFIASELDRSYPDLAAGRVIVAHLGNGASLCAIRGGRSIASTMGFSALDGLPMGTRCGQLDPGLVLYLIQQEGLDAEAISDLLYKQSGLLGLSGESHDMRVLEASATPSAQEAIAYFTFRIRREMGAMAAALGGVDGIVFTGGIGENSARVRQEVTETMGWMGIELDASANDANARMISKSAAPVKVLVLPTNEELVIARAMRTLIPGARARSA